MRMTTERSIDALVESQNAHAQSMGWGGTLSRDRAVRPPAQIPATPEPGRGSRRARRGGSSSRSISSGQRQRQRKTGLRCACVACVRSSRARWKRCLPLLSAQAEVLEEMGGVQEAAIAYLHACGPEECDPVTTWANPNLQT